MVFLADFQRAWWVRAQKGRDQRPRTRTKAHRPRERAIPSQQGHGAQRRSLPSHPAPSSQGPKGRADFLAARGTGGLAQPGQWGRPLDRKSAVEGKRWAVLVDYGGARIIK